MKFTAKEMAKQEVRKSPDVYGAGMRKRGFSLIKRVAEEPLSSRVQANSDES